jgi:SAM-dependent methyltransferase
MAVEDKKDSYDYNSIPLDYYDRVFHRNRGIQSKWHQLKFSKFKQAMGEYEQHLDIGCGPGTFIGILSPTRSSVGVDISDPQIAHAKRTYETPQHRFQHIPKGPLPFNDNSFDAVTIIELIEHLTLRDNHVLLQECRRVLKPGGRLFLSTPNYGSFWPFLEKIVNRLGDVSYEDQHITHFKKKSFRDLLKLAGFSVDRIEAYHFSAPFFAAISWKLSDFIERLEPSLLVNGFGNLLFGIGRK